MKVSQIKELLAGYSDDTELMIAWNDREGFEYVLDKPLPTQVWERAVERFDRHDLQDFNDLCNDLVYDASREKESA